MVSFKWCKEALEKLSSGEFVLQYSTIPGIYEWGVVESIDGWEVNVESNHRCTGDKSAIESPPIHFSIDLSNKKDVQRFKIKIVPLQEFKIISIK